MASLISLGVAVFLWKMNWRSLNFPLADLYQITMAYAYWKSGKKKDHAVFDLFFRQNPFQGEFTIFAGLEESLKFLQNFQYSDNGKSTSWMIAVQKLLTILINVENLH